MSWTCESCGRTFARAKQTHFCDRSCFEKNFGGSRAKWQLLYGEFLRRCQTRLGPFEEHFPSSGVMWKHSSTFADVKPKVNSMEILYYSDRLHLERQPYRTLVISANRVAHTVEVVDDSRFGEIIDWVVESYLLTSPKVAKGKK